MKTINKTKEISMEEMINKYLDRDRFLELCKKCTNYGKLWSCPPYSFNLDDYLDEYKYAYVIGTRMIFSEDTIIANNTPEKINSFTKYTLESMRSELGDKLLQLEEKYKGKSLYAGSCLLCASCNRQKNEACCNPDQMRYSLESLGFDVSKIAENLLNIELKWASDRLPEYFTLVSAFLAKERIEDLDVFPKQNAFPSIVQTPLL